MFSKELMNSLYETMVTKSVSSFAKEGELYQEDGGTDQYVFKSESEDAKILAVGHTDWVKYHEPQLSMDGSLIYCGQLDDRLGVWVINHLLKEVLPPDMPYDILLTDNEETGNSTAKLFDVRNHGNKKYNWMFEFDRKGSEVVMYDYETPTLSKELRKYGFSTGRGTFSDICCLTQLGCIGINVGTGYYHEHTDRCYANLEKLGSNVEKFAAFYINNYKRKFKINLTKARQKQKAKEKRFPRYNYGGYPTKHGMYIPKKKEIVYPTEQEIAQLSYDLGVSEEKAAAIYEDPDVHKLTDFEKDIIEDLKKDVRNQSIHTMSDAEFEEFQRVYHNM